MADRLSPARLRDGIAETLWFHVKAYELDGACDRLGMPPGGDWSHNSKRVYVRTRLAPVDERELFAIARRVVAEFGDEELERMLGAGGVRGVDGELRNLIFAANGPKPRIVLRDAINNIIEIVENAERCLVFDRPLSPQGLHWGELVEWWAAGQANDRALAEQARDLYRRLAASLASEPERVVFRAYAKRYGDAGAVDVPALIPQVYLHYDPYTRRELAAIEGEELPRQRMDFLLLLSDRVRVVIEVDGRQHFSEDEKPSPKRYAEMVAEDRSIRLAGYEVYRFGAYELAQPGAEDLVDAFFDQLFALFEPSGSHEAAGLE